MKNCLIFSRADHITDVGAYAAVLRPSAARLSVCNVCIAAKQCV